MTCCGVTGGHVPGYSSCAVYIQTILVEWAAAILTRPDLSLLTL